MHHWTSKWLLSLIVAWSGVLVHADDHAKQIEGWGTPIDPDADCVIEHKDGKLFISLPGTPNNLTRGVGELDAPRVLRDVDGDFTVQVKVTGEFNPDPESTVAPRGHAFNGAGLLVWQDDRHYIRLERNIWIDRGQSFCHAPLFEQVHDGANWPYNLPGKNLDFFEGDSMWFRLEREGRTVAAYYSHDGKEWTSAGTMRVRFPTTVSVGVSASNTAKSPFEVAFSDLQISRRD